jgi:carboxyl-terminal processing protease
MRSLLICLLLAAAAAAAPQARPQLTADQRVADFDQMWELVRDRYAYLAAKATDWDAVREQYRRRAAEAGDNRAFIAVLERALDELYDPHTHLGTNLGTSWRLPPHDLWVEWHDGAAVVEEVRRGSAAERAGLRAGMRIVEVNGVAVEQAVAERRPSALRGPDPEAEAWALASVAAGRRGRPRELIVLDGPVQRTVAIDDSQGAAEEPAVSSRTLAGNVGYIRIASFGDEASVEAFDRALEALRSTRALVVDVRDNPGGDTAVAKPIMGRLVGRTMQYAWMNRRKGAGLGDRWAEYVEARGPWTYRAPVVVLVNHFSESMAEGFAMGLDGMRRATVVGTRMGGLGAGIARETLEHSGIGVQISAEPVYHVGGAPRTDFVPGVLVRPATARGADPILAAALRYLDRRGASRQAGSKV